MHRLKRLLRRVDRALPWRPSARQASYIGLGLLGIFIILNLVVLVMYRDQTFPKLVLNGNKVGNRSRDELAHDLDRFKVLPDSITLSAYDKKVTVKTGELGITINKTKTIDSLFNQRSWLPIVNLLKTRQGRVVTVVDEKKLAAQEKSLAETFSKAPTDAALVLNNGTFNITNPADGYSFDWQKSRQVIISNLQQTKSTAAMVTNTKKPKILSKDLENTKKELEAAQNTKVALTYNGQTTTATAAQIGSWYKITGTKAELDQAAVRAYVVATGNGWGIRVQNIDAAVSGIASSLQARKALTFSVVAAPKARKTFSYCVAAKGVDASNLAGLRAKLASTYADGRGWGLGGDVSFVEVTSGCNFTVWLSAASLMSSFGAICDSLWSCAVSPNVILNFDRWTGASDAWNAAGGSLDNYRSMVINHETGHWLGFGHRNCGGTGQPAPVMQQQSISLQGCTFSPWPNAAELSTLRQTLGL